LTPFGTTKVNIDVATGVFSSRDMRRTCRVTPLGSIASNSRMSESSSSTHTVALVNAAFVPGFGTSVRPWAAWPLTVRVPAAVMSYFVRGESRNWPVMSIGTDAWSVAGRLTTWPGELLGK